MDLQTFADVSEALKFISKLQPGDKVQLHSLKIISPTPWNVVSRTLKNWRVKSECKEETIIWIQRVCNKAFEMLNEEGLSLSSSSEDKEDKGKTVGHRISVLMEDLVHAKQGIRNLISTYYKNKIFVSKLEVILENICHNVSLVQNIFG